MFFSLNLNEISLHLGAFIISSLISNHRKLALALVKDIHIHHFIIWVISCFDTHRSLHSHDFPVLLNKLISACVSLWFLFRNSHIILGRNIFQLWNSGQAFIGWLIGYKLWWSFVKLCHCLLGRNHSKHLRESLTYFGNSISRISEGHFIPDLEFVLLLVEVD